MSSNYMVNTNLFHATYIPLRKFELCSATKHIIFPLIAALGVQTIFEGVHKRQIVIINILEENRGHSVLKPENNVK